MSDLIALALSIGHWVLFDSVRLWRPGDQAAFEGYGYLLKLFPGPSRRHDWRHS